MTQSVMSLAVLLAAILVPLFALIAVSVWTDARKKEREAFYQNEFYKKLAELSAPQTQQVIEVMREQQRLAGIRIIEGLKLAGLILALAGVAIIIMSALLEPSKPVWAGGLVPLFVGAALLLYVYLLVPRTPPTEK